EEGPVNPGALVPPDRRKSFVVAVRLWGDLRIVLLEGHRNRHDKLHLPIRGEGPQSFQRLRSGAMKPRPAEVNTRAANRRDNTSTGWLLALWVASRWSPSEWPLCSKGEF